MGNGEWGMGLPFDYAQGKPIKRKPIVTVQGVEGELNLSSSLSPKREC